MAEIYHNNSQLKSVGVSVAYTPEQIAEYIKCRDDPVYFINNYCKIISLDEGIIPFKLYPCQENKVRVIQENRKVILMEGRQQGKTTVSAAFILWFVNFQSAKSVAILANKAAAAREVMARIQLMFELLPDFIKQGVVTYNKGDIELENKSKVFTGATSATGIRGKSCNLLYVDETAFISNSVAEQFFASVYPTISSGKTTKILLSSTPQGYNHFYTFWNDAQNKINDFVPLFIPYWEIPGRDASWADEQRRQLGEVKFNQEILCNFLGSSYTLLPGDTLSKLSPVLPIYSKDNLNVYEIPIKDHIYVAVADVAKGVGGDYSVITVIDITEPPFRLVAKYRDNTISPLLLPNVIYKIATDYNKAYTLLEINISEQVSHILYYELEYENLLLIDRKSTGLNRGQRLSGGFGTKPQLGVQTDKKVKRIGCSNLKSLMMENKLLIPDGDIISELSTFIETRDSFAADDGYHDDLVMTLVLFAWLTTQAGFKELSRIDIRKDMYSSQMQYINDSLTPAGFYSDGSETETVLLNF